MISILSLGISLYTYKKTYKLRLDIRNLNSRKAISEQFDEYSTLLHSEYLKLKDDLSKLSSTLCSANTSIGNVLDRYDNRNRNTSIQYQRYLRHLYVDLHRDITESFKHELSWQTAENIYHRLAIFKNKNLDRRLDFKKSTKKWKNLFYRKRNNSSYPEHTLMESDGFKNSFVELTESINMSDYIAIYNEFVDVCKELKEALNLIRRKCKKSYDLLESGTIKNSLQEFKLWEYSPLRDRYTQFKCLMKFIHLSRLRTLSNVEESPYLTLSQILYYGANIDMINELLCMTVFSSRE